MVPAAAAAAAAAASQRARQWSDMDFAMSKHGLLRFPQMPRSKS